MLLEPKYDERTDDVMSRLVAKIGPKRNSDRDGQSEVKNVLEVLTL